MADGRGARFRALRSGVARSADLFELQAHAGCARYRTRSPRAHRRLRALAGAAGAADLLDQRATLPPAGRAPRALPDSRPVGGYLAEGFRAQSAHSPLLRGAAQGLPCAAVSLSVPPASAASTVPDPTGRRRGRDTPAAR